MPGQVDDGPDDWFVPPPAATPSLGQPAPGAQPAAANSDNPPPGRPDPFAAFWSLIPASRAGAMAWHPPIFLGDSPTSPPATSTTPARPAQPPAEIPYLRTSGGLFDGLAELGPGSSGPGSSIPLGGPFDGPAQLASASPDPRSSLPFGGLLGTFAPPASSSPGSGSVFPPPPQPQPSDPQPVAPTGRTPITDYSTGEIAVDGAKSFGVGVGRFGIQSAGFLGDARELLASGAQRAADYLAPGSAPNAGSRVSDFLASYPLLRGPTSSQLQSAVESFTGPFYQPKTIIGDYAQTAGEFVPGALLMPEGSLATNALRYGLLPAISSETAGQLTKGTAAEPWARAFGGILGAAANMWRDVPWARSAPVLAEPLAESELSAAEQLAARRRAQLEVNKATGAAFEDQTANGLEQRGASFGRQITLETQSGLQTRIDFLSRDPGEKRIRCMECKASETARETKNQKKAFKEIAESGAMIVGAGKPGYEGGMQIPATRVEILRP